MPPPNLPAWFEQGDPWLTRRMRDLAARAAAERDIGQAVVAGMSRFLDVARAAVLGEPTPGGALTAAADDGPAPDLNAWPPPQVWERIVRESILPPIAILFGDRFAAEVGRALIADTPYRLAYLQDVFDRLKIWPAGAFDEVRAELLEGMAAGEDGRALRQRLGDVLKITARSRTAQANINALTRTIEDPATPAQIRREARARRAALYRTKDILDSRWEWLAARIARTEVMGAFNGGTYAGAKALSAATGAARFKQWWATSDNRVRSSHWAAHMQVKPLAEPFTVGGYTLDHPGQAGGPAHEVINCRCSLLILSPAEAAAEQARYAQQRPGRTDLKGRPLDDAGNPITPVVAAGTAQEVSDMTAPVVDPTAPPAPAGLPVGWRGRLVPYDLPSGDGRVIGAPPGGAARVRPLPVGFKWQERDAMGHDDAVVAGAITKVWEENGELWGSGPFDLGSADGAEVARRMAEGFAGWVSVDLDDVTSAWQVTDPDGNVVPEDEIADLLVEDEMGWLELPEGYSEVEIATNWRLMSATLVVDQAFPEAKVFAVYDPAEIVSAAELNAQREAEVTGGPAAGPAEPVPAEAEAALAASGGVLAAPAAWFTNPNLSGPTPMTITDDGRVYGHAGLFDTCHIGFRGRCITAPRGSDFNAFHLKAYRVREGHDIAVGALVMGTDHASTAASTSVAAAMAHYANTGHCAAYVRAGEDEHGVWVAGALDPGLSPERVVQARAMTLSGDWREVGGRVAFVAALAVNVAGFGVPRQTTGEDGRLLALVAAGRLMRAPRAAGVGLDIRRVRPGERVRFIVADPKLFAREVLAEQRRQEAGRAAAGRIAARVHGRTAATLAARVHRERVS